jgi:hypothetical protein
MTQGELSDEEMSWSEFGREVDIEDFTLDPYVGSDEISDEISHESEDEPDSPAADAHTGNQEAAAVQAMGQAMSAAPSGKLETPAAPAMMGIPGGGCPSGNQESATTQVV